MAFGVIFTPNLPKGSLQQSDVLTFVFTVKLQWKNLLNLRFRFNFYMFKIVILMRKPTLSLIRELVVCFYSAIYVSGAFVNIIRYTTGYRCRSHFQAIHRTIWCYYPLKKYHLHCKFEAVFHKLSMWVIFYWNHWRSLWRPNVKSRLIDKSWNLIGRSLLFL